jgi:hypothetical protein
MIWYFDETFFTERSELTQAAIEITAERRFGFRVVKLSIDPTLHEYWAHPVTDLPARNTLADRYDVTGSIRERYKWQPEPGIIPSLNHHQVTVVKGRRAQAN